MKSYRSKCVALALMLAMVCWMAFPPAQESVAQPYGPGVVSNLKRFDMCVKTAATHDLIVGVDGRRFRIVSLFVRSLSSTANNIYFGEEGNTDTVYGTNSTDVEALDALGISGKSGWVVVDGNLYETENTGTDFEITLSEAQAVAVTGTYVEIQ